MIRNNSEWSWWVKRLVIIHTSSSKTTMSQNTWCSSSTSSIIPVSHMWMCVSHMWMCVLWLTYTSDMTHSLGVPPALAASSLCHICECVCHTCECVSHSCERVYHDSLIRVTWLIRKYMYLQDKRHHPCVTRVNVCVTRVNVCVTRVNVCHTC